VQPTFCTKFSFRIRTRAGGIVDHLLIHGRDANEAERKLRQVYPGCEILDRDRITWRDRGLTSVSYEDVLGLITHAEEGLTDLLPEGCRKPLVSSSSSKAR